MRLAEVIAFLAEGYPPAGEASGPLATEPTVDSGDRNKATKADCPACGKSVTVTADGNLRTHGPKGNRCPGFVETEPAGEQTEPAGENDAPPKATTSADVDAEMLF